MERVCELCCEWFCFFFQAEDGIRDYRVTGVQTCALPILHHCVFEVLDNSIDEHLAGFCSHIDVTIHVDGSVSIRDDGRGIPVDIHPKFKIPAVELVLTNLHAGGKFGQGAYKYSGGLHGVGAKCVNALSDWFTVEVYRDGEVHTMSFAQGKTTRRLEVIGKS